MKNYIFTLLIVGLTACTTTHDEVKNNVPFPQNNQVPNCAADGVGCEQFNPDKDKIRPCTREYVPVCAEIQIECVTTPCEALTQTFPNRCVMSNNKRAKFLYEGTCK